MPDDKQDWRSDGVKEAAKWQAILDSIPVHYTPITPAIFKELLRQRLAMKCRETGLTWAQMAADAAIKRAIETGDIREVADRVDGRVPQPVVGADGGDIVIQIVKYGSDSITAPMEAKALPAPGVAGVGKRH